MDDPLGCTCPPETAPVPCQHKGSLEACLEAEAQSKRAKPRDYQGVAPPQSGKVNYVILNGAEFQKAVGTDYRLWAEAFVQTYEHTVQANASYREELLNLAGRFFRDAMEAGVRTAMEAMVTAEAEAE